jgi:transcriptional regulator GlxA family with amidase domain
VERLRVEAARRLLSESRLPVKRISQRCGFGSKETMRRSFLRLLATPPQDNRARFSTTAPGSAPECRPFGRRRRCDRR